MNRHPLLEARGLTIGYRLQRRPPYRVVEGIDAALHAGEFACLLGPNGAGKTTLIRTLTGMQPPLAGTVRQAGELLSTLSPRALAQRMSLVLTERAAVGMMPVATLVALGRHPYTDWAGRLRPDDIATVWRALADAGIEELAQRPVIELSDGERQKVMIARALAQEPQVMVLDEATAFLDLPRRVELMHLLRRLAHDGRRAILLSTHDLDLALRCADHLWLLPPGGPLRVGVPEDLVLSDAFAGAFAAEGVTFDKSAGAFTLKGSNRHPITLVGNGVPAMWTSRALERVGYHVVPDGEAEACVEVTGESARPEWRVRGREETYATLEALLDGLVGQVRREE